MYDSGGKLWALKYTDGNTYFYVRNAQGDIIKIVDVSGNAVVEYAYDAWGKLVSTVGSMAETLGADNPFRYRGYYYDTETGLYYLNQRFYNPEWGRFINADSYGGSIGGLLGHNVFAYCGNNPVMMSDPSGNKYGYYDFMIDKARKENEKKKKVLTDVKNKSNSPIIKDIADKALKNGMANVKLSSYYEMSYDDADQDYQYGEATLDVAEWISFLVPFSKAIGAAGKVAKIVNGIFSAGVAGLHFTDTISTAPAREGAYYKFELIIDSKTVINGRIGPSTEEDNRLNSITTEFY